MVGCLIIIIINIIKKLLLFWSFEKICLLAGYWTSWMIFIGWRLWKLERKEREKNQRHLSHYNLLRTDSSCLLHFCIWFEWEFFVRFVSFNDGSQDDNDDDDGWERGSPSIHLLFKWWSLYIQHRHNDSFNHLSILDDVDGYFDFCCWMSLS